MVCKKIEKFINKKIKNKDLRARIISSLDDLNKEFSFGIQKVDDFNSHYVEVLGERYIALDFKLLNRYTSSSGRGNYRVLYNPNLGGISSIAEHSNSNGYNLVA